MENGIVTHNVAPESPISTYDVFIFGKAIFTTVTKSHHIVDMWIDEVLNSKPEDGRQLLVGIDVKLADRRFENWRLPRGTIQLAVARQCLIYHIFFPTTLPRSLERFLLDRKNNRFVGFGAKPKLDVILSGGAPYVDLGILAAERYGRPELNALSALAMTVLGKAVEKPPVVYDLDHPLLLDRHVQCACVDAYVSWELGSILCRP